MKSTKLEAKKIKVSLIDDRYMPEIGNVLKARIEEPVEGFGRKIAFNNRYAAVVDTGVVVDELPDGHILCFSLVERLSEKGMVLSTTVFSGSGPIKLSLVNCGREIVNLIDGETLVEAWLKKSEKFEWSV